MNKFGVFVIVCSIAVSYASPLNNEQNVHFVRQTASQSLHDNILRQRLKNFPASSQYQTQINYPGGVYSGQNAYVSTGSRIDYQQPQTQAFVMQQTFPAQERFPVQQQYHVQQPIPAAPVVSTLPPVPITTTVAPIIINEPEVFEEAPVPVPAVRAPIRRIRPQRVQTAQRFQGQDFVDEDNLPEEEVPVPHVETEEERLLREEQAKNAHYSFGTSIEDSINDHSIHREETREGLALRGMYSYSDGFYKRTIHYQADENGYRVVKEEVEPIGDGPQFNPTGTADVTANLHNNHLSYSITADDFVREKKKKKIVPEEGRQIDDRFFIKTRPARDE